MSLFNKRTIGDSCRPILGMDPEQTERYRHFRFLLNHNRVALTLIADLEQTYYDNRPFTVQMLERICSELLSAVESMVQSLSSLSAKPHDRLSVILRSIHRYSKDELRPDLPPTMDVLTLPMARVEANHE
jgi:hypothetical protein